MAYYRRDPRKVDWLLAALLILCLVATVPGILVANRQPDPDLPLAALELALPAVGFFVVVAFAVRLQNQGFRFTDHDRCQQPVLYGVVLTFADARPDGAEIHHGADELPGARTLNWTNRPPAGLHREGGDMVLTSLRREWRCKMEAFTANAVVRGRPDDHLLLSFGGTPGGRPGGDRVAFRPRWSGDFGAGPSQPSQTVTWARSVVQDIVAPAPDPAASLPAPATPSAATAGTGPRPYPREPFEPFLTAARAAQARITNRWLRHVGIFLAVLFMGMLLIRLTGITIPDWLGTMIMIVMCLGLVLSIFTAGDSVPAWNNFACPSCKKCLVDFETFQKFSTTGRCPHCSFQALTD